MFQIEGFLTNHKIIELWKTQQIYMWVISRAFLIFPKVWKLKAWKFQVNWGSAIPRVTHETLAKKKNYFKKTNPICTHETYIANGIVNWNSIFHCVNIQNTKFMKSNLFPFGFVFISLSCIVYSLVHNWQNCWFSFFLFQHVHIHVLFYSEFIENALAFAVFLVVNWTNDRFLVCICRTESKLLTRNTNFIVKIMKKIIYFQSLIWL